MGWMDEEREALCREWMTAAQGGDSQAYERLLTAILPPLRRFVSSRLPGSPAAEDVVQNVLLSVHRARHTYRTERPFGPWLRAIARNAVLDSQRERSRRLRRELPLQAAEQVAAETSPREAAGLSPAVAQALAQLPSPQREAVELVKIQGLSVAEAAARAGVSRGALKVRAHRGYRALREILGSREET